LPLSVALCVQVIVIPDASKITVFSKGRAQGSIGDIPAGGQTQPIPTEGLRLQWKKAQKKEKKNITSEVINSIIPSFMPC
jgi:hypothetical protein